MQMVMKDLIAPFGCQRAYYFNCLRFSNEVEQYGVIPTGIECLPGRPGFRAEMCSGEYEYEIRLDNSWVRLGLIRLNQPPVILSEGGAASQAVWDRFAQLVREMEDK